MLMFHHAGGPGVAGLLTVGAVAMLAAAAQTISGFGMNLILAPAAQLTLPGAAAVRLVAGTGAILNTGLLAAGRRAVLWRPALHLLVPAMAATFLLGPVIPRASAGLVSVLVAVATILALAASASAALPPRLTGRAGAFLAGALAGALNVTSGVSGPPVAAYAATQPWPPRQLVATVQAVFLPTNTAAFIVLHQVPVPVGMFGAGAAGTGAGLLAGTLLRDRIPARLVRTAVLVIAGAGAGIIVMRFLVG